MKVIQSDDGRNPKPETAAAEAVSDADVGGRRRSMKYRIFASVLIDQVDRKSFFGSAVEQMPRFKEVLGSYPDTNSLKNLVLELQRQFIQSRMHMKVGNFKKWAFPGHFFNSFMFFLHSNAVDDVCSVLANVRGSNPGSLVAEATALPTAPLPRPQTYMTCLCNSRSYLWFFIPYYRLR